MNPIPALRAFAVTVLFATLIASPCQVQAQPPPLESFLANPEFKTAKLSPDGKYLALSVPRDNQDVLLIMDLETMQPLAGFESEENGGIYDFWWANGERIILSTFVNSRDTDRPLLTGNLFAFNIDNTQRIAIAGPVTGEFAYYEVLDTLRDDDTNIRVVRWDIDTRGASGTIARSKPEGFLLNIYARPLATRADSRVGDQRLKEQVSSPLPWGQLFTDLDGNIRLATAMSDEGRMQASLRESDTWNAVDLPAEIGSSLNNESGHLLGFGPENKGLYHLATSEHGTTGVAYHDLASGQSRTLFAHEKYDVSANDVIWTSDESEIIGVAMIGALPEAHYFSEHPEVAIHKSLDRGLPGLQIKILNFSDNQRKAVALVRDSKTPAILFLLDRDKSEFSPLFFSHPQLVEAPLSTAEPLSITARDGVTVEGYLTPGIGVAGAGPMIVLPHGGPHGIRDVPLFNPEVQLLASRGYSVLQVNYRGSGGYGNAFLEMGYGNWGTAMVDDVVDATQWAIGQGHAEAHRICIMGSSYGGYSAMMAIARYPDLYRCGIGLSGVYDLNLMRKSDIPFLPGGETYLDRVVGSDEAILAANSPLTLASGIKVPVFLAHGNRDQRVRIQNAQRFRDALKDAGVDHEWMLLRNAGHGLFLPESKVRLYTRILEFLEGSLNAP